MSGKRYITCGVEGRLTFESLLSRVDEYLERGVSKGYTLVPGTLVIDNQGNSTGSKVRRATFLMEKEQDLI